MSGIEHNFEKNSAWCALLLKGITSNEKIAHVGKGKFRVLDDNGGLYINTIVDASDIYQGKQ